ncbi:MAG: DUF4332 domain-containing protein [Hyphomicrobiaceae bacterium]|nr:DUF4332 domain-containing protein [Hyphomicrobiaceae bacterium]
MNLLFHIIYATHANDTHEKLALDALRYLETDEASAWQSLFLNHAQLYLSGSRAPDLEFKDFKNHVLHVRDNYWGGAPEKVESWYNLLVGELKRGNWEQAAWCAGVLSHYYTDPINPLHTAQCDAENNIHKAVEWLISRCYGDLRKRGLKAEKPDIYIGSSETWLKEMVINGAEFANYHYETIISGYNFRVGITNSRQGLDVVCRSLIGKLLVYASYGLSRILDRAFEDSQQLPPRFPSTSKTLLAMLRAPRKLVGNKLSNAKELKALRHMYEEFEKIGRIDQTMNEEQKVIRDLHTQEVLLPLASEREAQRAKRCQSPPRLKESSALSEATQRSNENYFQPGMTLNVDSDSFSLESVGPKNSSSINTIDLHDLHELQDFQGLHEPDNKVMRVPAYQKSDDKAPHLRLSDHVGAGPSVGPKTAVRLEAVGIVTIQDLLCADPQNLAGKLNIRYVNRKAILDWQDQARLMLHIPGLRVTHAQLCIGAGYRSPENIAVSDAAEINESILKFAATRSGQRILGSGKPPDFYTIREWISNVDKGIAA